MPFLAFAGIALSLLQFAPPKEVWTEFRGPNGTGIVADTTVPLSWSETQNIKWKTPIAGKGWSSPVVWGDQIWMTSATDDGGKMFVYCVDKRTGKILHQRLLFENATTEPIHDLNSYASPTPVIEEGRVTVHFGTYGTACIDTRTFKTLWERRDLNCHHAVGPGSSPILFEDKVILTFDAIDVQYLIALNKRTGDTLWKTPRSTKLSHVAAEERKAFSTPIVVQVDGQPMLITASAQADYAYDPRDGREIFQFRNRGFSSSCRPLVAFGMVFMNVAFGENNGLQAARLDGKGDVTDTHVVWKYGRGVPNKPSMLLIDDLLYMVSDGGIMSCLEAKTGTLLWHERLGGSFSSSPICIGGTIYACDERGVCHVLKPGRAFKKIGENQLAEGCMATPAVSGKALFVRTKTHLYRIE